MSLENRHHSFEEMMATLPPVLAGCDFLDEHRSKEDASEPIVFIRQKRGRIRSVSPAAQELAAKLAFDVGEYTHDGRIPHGVDMTYVYDILADEAPRRGYRRKDVREKRGAVRTTLKPVRNSRKS